MRILSIDFGKKRTGLAVTDPLQIIANPLETVATATLFDYLENYILRVWRISTTDGERYIQRFL